MMILMKILVKMMVLCSSPVWGQTLLWLLDSEVSFNSRNANYTFKAPAQDTYEVTLGGGAGGSFTNTKGGKGGQIAAIINMQSSELLMVVLGGAGKAAEFDNCAGAGGGGGTFLYIGPSAGSVWYQPMLVAPGGGGSGHNMQAAAPDDLELNEAVKCTNTDLFAAEGRSIKGGFNRDSPHNYTANEVSIVPENLTLAGCPGGFGGGGYGAYGYDKSNRSSFGGGGGGGGYVGGAITVAGKSSGCVAGGPGKPYCLATKKDIKCGVATSHDKLLGFALIKKHELYKELPSKDRTNQENPGNNLKDGSGSNAGKKTQIIMGFIIMSTLSVLHAFH